jgi:hypothetical protein
VTGAETGHLIIESGMTIVFTMIIILVTYMIRLNLLKAFEMTLLAEESAVMATTIFNKMADSIILVSD